MKSKLRQYKSSFYNKIIPIYYKISRNINKLKLENRICDKEVIVSLTTIPSRIDKTWITIETIMNQSKKPNRIILWLGEDKFKGVELPKQLLEQQGRGLEIRYCEDLICHTKYYYTMRENPSAIVITVDDDIIYPRNLISKLIKVYKDNMGCIVCFRAHEMILNSDGNIKPYNEWNWNSIGKLGPSNALLQTGVSGVLYPPNCLDEEVFNKEKIKELCPRADDVWLKFMALKKGTPIVKISKKSKLFTIIDETQEEALNKYNVSSNGNDEQIRKVVQEYNIDLKKIINPSN